MNYFHVNQTDSSQISQDSWRFTIFLALTHALKHANFLLLLADSTIISTFRLFLPFRPTRSTNIRESQSAVGVSRRKVTRQVQKSWHIHACTTVLIGLLNIAFHDCIDRQYSRKQILWVPCANFLFLTLALSQYPMRIAYTAILSFFPKPAW